MRKFIKTYTNYINENAKINEEIFTGYDSDWIEGLSSLGEVEIKNRAEIKKPDFYNTGGTYSFLQIEIIKDNRRIILDGLTVNGRMVSCSVSLGDLNLIKTTKGLLPIVHYNITIEEHIADILRQINEYLSDYNLG